MRHLINALATQQLRVSIPENDLKQLLSKVRDASDNKTTETFYERLEKIIIELKTESHSIAFQRPVKKSEAPDYDLVIKHPMDLSTMAKKVKQHVYKSKRNFQDDLNLIWDNCLTYNSQPAHPLRRSAMFMRQKADHILESIPDRNERLNSSQLDNITFVSAPPATAESTPHVNGVTTNGTLLNGQSGLPSPSGSKSASPAPRAGPPPRQLSQQPQVRKKEDTQFPERSAIIRTAEAMSMFLDLDSELERTLAIDHSLVAGPSTLPMSAKSSPTKDKLRNIIEGDEDLNIIEEEDEETNGMELDRETPPSTKKRDDVIDFVERLENASKRKRVASAQAPRKRAKLEPLPSIDEQATVETWWSAVRSNTLLAAGVPGTPHMFASSGKGPMRTPAKPQIRKKARRRKKPPTTPPRSLLHLIQGNIGTLRRMRRIHSKFVQLQSQNSDDAMPALLPRIDYEEERRRDQVEGLGWKEIAGIGRQAGEIGEREASHCMEWMTSKVLEHAGFESTSKIASNVLSSVTAHYLMNVGRTLRLLMDRFSQTMTPEELILHTLQECGVPAIQDLERYIKDDVIRYGGRLGELERKLESAYRDITATDAIADDSLFSAEDELMAGNFTSDLGEDFFGFKELGLDKEHGMANLSVPRRLLLGRAKKADSASANAATGEPPLPFPPPPPFIALEMNRVESQIGLLRPFYTDRFAAMTLRPPGTTPAPTSATTSGADPISSLPATLLPQPTTAPSDAPPDTTQTIIQGPTTLPDDPPNQLRVKMGPLGQITITNTVAQPKKKPPKPKDGTDAVDKTPKSKKIKESGTTAATGEEQSTQDATVVAIDASKGETPSKKKKGPPKKKKAGAQAIVEPPAPTPTGPIVS